MWLWEKNAILVAVVVVVKQAEDAIKKQVCVLQLYF